MYNSNAMTVLRLLAINPNTPFTPMILMYMGGFKTTSHVKTLLRILCEVGFVERVSQKTNKGDRGLYRITQAGFNHLTA